MEQNVKPANQVEYMLVERGVELTRTGEWKIEKGSDDLILKGFAQVSDTMTYKRLCDAVNKRRAIIKDECSGFDEGDIMIARLEIIR